MASRSAGRGAGIRVIVARFLSNPTAANFLAMLTTKTGTGLPVFDTSPVLTTPALGVPTAIDLTNATNVPAAAAGTLTGATLAAGVTASSLTSFGASPTLVNPIITSGVARSFAKTDAVLLNLMGAV